MVSSTLLTIFWGCDGIFLTKGSNSNCDSSYSQLIGVVWMKARNRLRSRVCNNIKLPLGVRLSDTDQIVLDDSILLLRTRWLPFEVNASCINYYSCKVEWRSRRNCRKKVPISISVEDSSSDVLTVFQGLDSKRVTVWSR